MILDLKLFLSGYDLKPGTFWVMEGMPGNAHVSQDQTQWLSEHGYWQSYNRPFYKRVFVEMGYANATAYYGDMFSWSKCPRAQIFDRDASSIASRDDVETFILSNNYQTDPLSQGYPGNAIAARFDILGGPTLDSPYDSWWEQGTHGATDGKVVCASGVSGQQEPWSVTLRGISGPPVNSQCPPFSWLDPLWSGHSHLGQPDTFNFNWRTFTFSNQNGRAANE